MRLTPKEMDRLTIFTVAEMARVFGLEVIVAGRVGEDRPPPDRLPWRRSCGAPTS